ncbi:Zinc finger, CCHC-type [Sesbania bispinosa]|nr:Zinc finger, CCHC-type [Sesbania bispinosa]
MKLTEEIEQLDLSESKPASIAQREVDLRKVLIPQFRLNGRAYQVEYEGLFLVCFCCGKYGHGKEGCPVAYAAKQQQNQENDAVGQENQNQANVQKGGNVDGSGGPRPNDGGEITNNAFGPWMLVQKTNRKRQNGPKKVSGGFTSAHSGAKLEENMRAQQGGSRFNALSLMCEEEEEQNIPVHMEITPAVPAHATKGITTQSNEPTNQDAPLPANLSAKHDPPKASPPGPKSVTHIKSLARSSQNTPQAITSPCLHTKPNSSHNPPSFDLTSKKNELPPVLTPVPPTLLPPLPKTGSAEVVICNSRPPDNNFHLQQNKELNVDQVKLDVQHDPKNGASLGPSAS